MLNISAARRKTRNAAELNMAPLIDMVFILLIFFLVNTSFVKETGIDVSRPTAATAAVKPNATILIAVDQANRIFMDHREIDLRAVRANTERALAENPWFGDAPHIYSYFSNSLYPFVSAIFSPRITD